MLVGRGRLVSGVRVSAAFPASAVTPVDLTLSKPPSPGETLIGGHLYRAEDAVCCDSWFQWFPDAGTCGGAHGSQRGR